MSTENSAPKTNSLLQAMDALENSGHTEIIPVASPLKTSTIKNHAINIVVVGLALFLVIMAIVGGIAMQDRLGATVVSTSCVNNMKFEGKVPAKYADMHPDKAVKAFQADNPRLAKEMLNKTSLGCGQVGRPIQPPVAK